MTGRAHADMQVAQLLLTQGVSVKKYPCCYGTHRTADAMLALRPRGSCWQTSRIDAAKWGKRSGTSSAVSAGTR